MKAVVKKKREYGYVEVTEVPEPKIENSNDVLIEVKSAAICGSDLHAYEYLPSYEFMKIPIILGHEFSGIVKQVGKNVKNFKPGDYVMGESNKYCGECENCRIGKTNICYNSQMRGIVTDGVMAEMVKIDEKFLHKIPEGLSFNDAAAAQPCSISIHAVIDNCIITPGDNVVVFGPGIIGQVAAQLARAQGADKIIIVGTNEDEKIRLPIARKDGFLTVNIQKDDILEKIKKITGSPWVDVVLECSGAPKALQTATRIIKKGGFLTIISIYGKNVDLPVTNLVRNEINLRTSYTSTWKNYEQALNFLSCGIINVGPLCKTYKFDDALNAFKDALNKDVLKPILSL